MENLIHRIACVLNKVNENKENKENKPTISILDYLQRLKKYFKCDDIFFICAIIYLDKYIEMVNKEYDIYKFILLYLTIAVKYWNDDFYKNTLYSKIGGIPLNEFNNLEVKLLFSIQFDLDIKPAVFDEYYEQLNKHTCSNCNS
jgi:hypothetical protein